MYRSASAVTSTGVTGLGFRPLVIAGDGFAAAVGAWEAGFAGAASASSAVSDSLDLSAEVFSCALAGEGLSIVPDEVLDEVVLGAAPLLVGVGCCVPFSVPPGAVPAAAPAGDLPAPASGVAGLCPASPGVAEFVFAGFEAEEFGAAELGVAASGVGAVPAESGVPCEDPAADCADGPGFRKLNPPCFHRK